MGEVLGSRIVLRSGDEVFTPLEPNSVMDRMTTAAGRIGASTSWPIAVFVTLPLLGVDDNDVRSRSAYLQIQGVDVVEPLDGREVEAHRRDREEWIANG